MLETGRSARCAKMNSIPDYTGRHWAETSLPMPAALAMVDSRYDYRNQRLVRPYSPPNAMADPGAPLFLFCCFYVFVILTRLSSDSMCNSYNFDSYPNHEKF